MPFVMLHGWVLPNFNSVSLADRGSITIDVCKDCFYMNRTKLDIHCNHCDLGDKVCVKWNSKEERYETTEASIRPIPDSMPIHVNHVAMCDPRRGWCKKDLCTFAHGQAELRTWNRLLKSTKEQQGNLCFQSTKITWLV